MAIPATLTDPTPSFKWPQGSPNIHFNITSGVDSPDAEIIASLHWKTGYHTTKIRSEDSEDILYKISQFAKCSEQNGSSLFNVIFSRALENDLILLPAIILDRRTSFVFWLFLCIYGDCRRRQGWFRNLPDASDHDCLTSDRHDIREQATPLKSVVKALRHVNA
jgi:hypothetical protein